MADLRPLLTMICVMCHIARPLTIKQYVRFQGGICPEKFQLDQIENG